MSETDPAARPYPVPDPYLVSDPYPIRPIAEDEFDQGHLIDQHAFHGSPLTAGDRERVLSRFEFDRSLAAIDPDSGTPAGVTSIYSFEMTVPGGTLPAAGVTFVGVLPSHRRRGVLRSLMHRQLADIGSAGREPLAVLWASEAGIYGRYGYGRASWHLAFTIRRGEVTMTPGAVGLATGLRLRLVAPTDARPDLVKVYDSVLPSRPGFFARSDPWWQRLLHDPEDERKGASPLRCVLAEDGSGPRGYALYSGLSRWEDETFLPDSTLTVRELVAAASAALWSDLLSRDLTTEFRAALRPVDDPLLSHLADPRRARPQISDGLWVRLIDVGAALAGRRYACPVDVVIEVRDPVLAGNAGRWRLRTHAGSDTGTGLAGAGLAAACDRVSDPADVALDIAELGAGYLGGTRLGTLAQAGLVSELRPGAVRQLTAAMAWDPAPWCPMIF